MILFIYDHTFEGLLTCIFDAYFRKTFPDSLLMEGEPLPLFYDEAIHIATDEEKAVSGHLRTVSQDKIKFLFFIKRNRM